MTEKKRVIRQVDPLTAKTTGRFLRSFDQNQYEDMQAYGALMEVVAKRMHVKGEIVFTCMCHSYEYAPERRRRVITWALFLILDTDKE